MSDENKPRSIWWLFVIVAIAATSVISDAVVDLRENSRRKQAFESQQELIHKQMLSEEDLKKRKPLPPRPKAKRHTR